MGVFNYESHRLTCDTVNLLSNYSFLPINTASSSTLIDNIFTNHIENPDHSTHGLLVTEDMILRASIHQAVRRLTARSREVSKPRDSGLNFSNRSEIWQVPRQRCCRGACQISERYDNCNIQSRGFETSRDLAVRRLTA